MIGLAVVAPKLYAQYAVRAEARTVRLPQFPRSDGGAAIPVMLVSREPRAECAPRATPLPSSLFREHDRRVHATSPVLGLGLMTEPKRNPQVDAFLREAEIWRAEFAALRAIVLDCGLTEEVKWGQPCYTLDKRNIVLMHGFKDYCALLFFKGALLKNPNGILIQQTENVQAGRQIRFTGVRQIVDMESVIKTTIRQAIEVEKAGLKVEKKNTADFSMPEEFKMRLNQDEKLHDAFYALTPGRQRAYLLYFSSAKQSKTRESRIDKYVQPILDGKGLDD